MSPRTITAKQFTGALDQLGWSKADAALYLNVNLGTIYRWATGDRDVPGPVVVVLEMQLEKAS